MKTLKSWKLCPAVAGMMLFGALGTLPVVAQNYPSLILAQSPVDYWPFSETNASAAPNTVSNLGSTGTSATGYLSGGAITGEPGIVGNCVLLTNEAPGEIQYIGNCFSRIDIPNMAALNPEPPFTIEFWAKAKADGTNGFYPNDAPGLDTTGLCAISSDSAFPNYDSRSGYLFYALPNSWTFRLGGEESYTATAIAPVSVTANTWMHIVGEFDGTNASLYVDGVLQGTGSASPAAPFHVNSWVATRIGGTSLSGNEYTILYENELLGFYYDGNRGWDGWIDEFAVYNTLLSSNTIMSHYTTATTNPSTYDALVLASSPVGYWNLDEAPYTPPSPNSGTFAADLGSLGDNGTNTYGTAADQPGVPGLSTNDHSVFYNGTLGSFVANTNVAGPSFTETAQPMTLAAWIKPNAFGFMRDIIMQGINDTTALGAENFLSVGDAWDWEIYFADGDNNPVIVPDVVYYSIGAYDGVSAFFNSAAYPAPAGDIGHWVFLVGTYDGTNWNMYRDGSLVAQFADGSLGPVAVGTPWSVGSDSFPNPYYGQYFDGLISEAAIFTNALDAATIQTLYNAAQLPPVITQAPQAPFPAYVGVSTTLSVWADGSAPLSYQWISNGVPLVGQTTTNLALSNLTAAADGTYEVVVTNAYGSVTSSVLLHITPNLPSVTVAPPTATRWVGFPFTFAPVNLTDQQLSFQWDLDGGSVTGATNSSFTGTVSAGTIGNYTLVISNSFAAATSSVSTVSILTPPNNYVSTILGDGPLSYLRLDEKSGTIAYDYAGGNNGIYYGNITHGVPGYSLIDTDTAAYFPGGTNNYVGDIGTTAINFPGTNAQFSIEAWANGGASQAANAALVVKGTGNNGGTENEQFCIDVSGGLYRFYVNSPESIMTAATATTGPDGNWHHLVGVCNGSSKAFTFYIDGAVAATAAFPPTGIIDSQDAVSIGAERSGPLPAYDWDYTGTISQVAIYPTALSAVQVSNHYAAAYGPNLPPFITIPPVSATNYVSLPVTLSVNAAGTVPLSYQWNFVGTGPIAGATGNSFTIPSLTYANAGLYTVGITNTLTGGVVTGLVSAPVTIAVLAPPTNPPAISGLVMHLTFDNTLADATGRGNNATNEASGGAPLITNDYVPGELGEAFTYQTTVSSSTTNANYASLGVRPDLQFGASASFTVSMWVQLPINYTGNDLPFFCDVVGSTFGYPGFCFEPSFGTVVAGGWGFSVFANSVAGEGVYGPVGSINDGNWHNLVYIIDRVKGASVYLDGTLSQGTVQAGTTVVGIGNINSINAATIGQDPTGLYPQPGTANIDDLGVWQRALTPLEAASIYIAAVSNQLSFVGTPPSTFALKVLAGPKLQLTWSAGTLQSTTNLPGPWTAVAGATSPYTNSPTGAQQFFRVQE